MTERSPVVIAYDGSELARAAVRHAADLFPERRAVLATVWEPGLAMVSMASSGPVDPVGISPDFETIEAIDRGQHEHAVSVAQEGAELARSLGMSAEAHAEPDELDVADTLMNLARERSAAAIVVGSHGISGLRSRMLGGVSRKLIQHSDRPVLVVQASRAHDPATPGTDRSS